MHNGLLITQLSSNTSAMNRFRNSFFIKPVSLMLIVVLMNMTFFSCKKDNDEPDNVNVHAKEFTGNAFTMTTDRTGKKLVNSNIVSQGEEFDLQYDFRIQDQAGNPVDGINITYNELNGKSIIYIHDEQNRYASTFFIGTPRELETYFGGSGLKTQADFSSNKAEFKDSEFLITLSILAIVTVLAIGVAEVGFILNAYKVQEFYLTDYVSETEDYILYCKDFNDIAELIKARTGMVLNLTSIFVSFISLGGSGPSLVIELTNAVGTVAADKIRDELFSKAVDAWGVSMNDLVGHKVAVKVFPYEESNTFGNARNLFATYTIEYDSEICTGNGIISGSVVDAETGYGIEDAIVRLSGQSVSTDLTTSIGEYSFEGLEQGNYQIEVEKSGYIIEEKQVNFDGSAAVVNFVLSQTIASDAYRVVLTWGENPQDMDIHIYTQNLDHIYYMNQGSLASYPYIYLDIDDLHSYGPETMTYSQIQASSIYVHNYSGYPDIKQSSAEIRVYNGNSILRTFQVPASGSGYWWHVFDFTNSGSVVEQNYLTDLKVSYSK
jgi:hypothetical protein